MTPTSHPIVSSLAGAALPFAHERCLSPRTPLPWSIALFTAFSPSLTASSIQPELSVVSLLLYLFENSVKANLLHLTTNPAGAPVVLRVSLCPSSSFPPMLTLTGLRFLGGGHTGLTSFAGLAISLAFKSSDVPLLVFLSLLSNISEMLSLWGKEGGRYLRGGVA